MNIYMKLLLILGICNIPAYNVDQIEINTHYDQNGEPQWQQIIVWKRYDDKLHNVGWRFIKDVGDYPVKCNEQYYITAWNDKRRIIVTSKSLIRSHTQSDPEREDTRSYWKGEAPNIFSNGNHTIIND